MNVHCIFIHLLFNQYVILFMNSTYIYVSESLEISNFPFKFQMFK